MADRCKIPGGPYPSNLRSVVSQNVHLVVLQLQFSDGDPSSRAESI